MAKMTRFIIDASSIKFHPDEKMLVPKFEFSEDRNAPKVQMTDKATGLPLWTIEVSALTSEERGHIKVTIPSAKELSFGLTEEIKFEKLTIYPYVKAGSVGSKGSSEVSFSALGIVQNTVSTPTK